MMIDSRIMVTESANSISEGTRVVQAIGSVIWKENVWQGNNSSLCEVIAPVWEPGPQDADWAFIQLISGLIIHWLISFMEKSRKSKDFSIEICM